MSLDEESLGESFCVYVLVGGFGEGGGIVVLEVGAGGVDVCMRV